MLFHERIKKARTEAGLSQIEVADFFQKKGVAVNSYTISRWENGTRKLFVEDFAVLCECYKVYDALQLLTGRPSPLQSDILIEGLNNRGVAHIKNYINILKGDPVFTNNEKVIDIRTYRLYDLPVSAGTGSYLEDSSYEEITADDLVPDDADYAVRVRGDSMEPKFSDSQIIFIREQQTLEEGEIGIFSLNNEAYLKKMGHDCLISLNPDYDLIPIKEWDDFIVFGKVVG